MKKSIGRLIPLVLLLMGIWYAGTAGAIDLPHNPTDDIMAVNCNNCHYDPASPPVWTTVTPSQDNTILNNLCTSCHKPGVVTDKYADVLTHSSYKTSNKYGTWVMECRTCHQPHYQQQVRAYSSVGSLVTGTVTAVSKVSTTMSFFTVDNALSPSTYTNYVFIPNTAYPGVMYRIISNTTNTVTVMGNVNTTYAQPNKPYAIRYGKMVKNQVSTPYSGTKTVLFFQPTGTNSFADGDATYEGVCEVCHTRTSHFQNSGAAPDQLHTSLGSGAAGSVCTICHSHREGFKGTNAGCIGCHEGSLGSRSAVVKRFRENSHHVQGIEVTNIHCYQCHWEANSDGSMNATYHGGSAAPGSPVDLVIYETGTRPTSYTEGTTAVQYTANGMRTEINKITTHCLGCHSDQNDTTQPFGDGKTPKQYAWDGTSIGLRYGETGTTPWGKYTTVSNAAQKNITKAYSAHGNAAANQEGWSSTTGVDGVISDFTGTTNVVCFDCHNSHGSNISGITTNYTSSTTNGGILKDTIAGLGGYSVTYQPQPGGTSSNKNAYSPGAGLCFDCHMNADSGTTPWGYSGTFGASLAIMGYWDTPYFGPGTSGPEQRYAYKSKSEKGGHFGASTPLSGPPAINGLCTPCHDPHGISPTLGSNMNYGVPMLKGTWLTSPYKEDAAPANNAKGTVRDSTYPTGSDGTPREGVPYHIDQNTFGANIRASVTGIIQTDTQFAGLCLNCHTKNSLTDGANGGAWKSVDRIHESVKGWGANTKHNYPCSKCHTPHNSSLPRLMATNCLNKDHKGRVKYNISPVLSGGGNGDDFSCYGDSTTLGFCWWFPQWSFVYGNGGGRMPGSWSGSWPGDYTVTCHENNAADQSWNTVTAWAEDTPVITSGPSAGSFTAVGSNVQATITWGTSTGYSTSYVDYGLTPSYGLTTGNDVLVLNHSVVIQNLTNHSTYNYRVRSRSGAGQETASGNNTFYISMPPAVPVLTAETDTTCGSSCSVTLEYSSSDPDTGPIQYYVEVDDDPAFGSVNYNSGWISGTSWSPALPTNTTWYWRVKARDANHTTPQDPPSGWPAMDSFIMSDGIAPPQVTLTGPADTTGFADLYCGGSPTIGFSWNAVPPLAEYSVQISTDSTFTTVNYSSGWISATSWSAVITPGATYYWRVQARDAVSYATGPWSSTWSFGVTDLGCKSSCPFVYVWDGGKYQYITDIQGSAIGYPPDFYMAKFVTMYQPVYVVLNGLAPDGSGNYNVKLRETLSEISYVDETKLLAVDYPEGYEIASSTAESTYQFWYVNPFKLYTLKNPRPPISAVNENSADVLASVLAVDGNPLPAQVNVLAYYIFDFGRIKNPANAKLVIDGWSAYGTKEYGTTQPTVQPYIEVMNGLGAWVKVKSFGVPAGDMKRMVIDISNIFLSDDQRIRIHTGVKSGVVWRIDRLMLDDSAPVPVTVREVSVDSADLHHRGMVPHSGSNFDHRITADDGVLPDNQAAYGYGKFTRYGDVKPLLDVTDDMFAIMRHGDEISLTFTGILPPLPQGMVRGLILKADVYYKKFQVDNNVELLPFHGMSIYPYDPAVENYPTDAAHEQYRQNYNTREYSQ